jgi:DNA-binding winged helix-turn-helix (wHTH) protein/TolB-like protein
MAASSQKQWVYQFGSFRVDPIHRVLRKDGETVALQPKTFDLLLLLVENNGEALEKDELMQKLWPDTVVEESNLSQNIYILRKVLGTGPDGHKYIQTIPKRGYRFTADVRGHTGEAAGLIIESQSVSHVLTEEQDGDTQESGDRLATAVPSSVQHRASPRLKIIAAAALLGALFGATYLWIATRSKPAKASAGLKSIAVLPFKLLGAGSNDEYLGVGLADTLITKLSSTGRIVVRPTSAILKYSAAQFNPVEAGRDQGVELVLDGSIQRSGEKIRVTVRLLGVRDGAPLWAYTYDERYADVLAL